MALYEYNNKRMEQNSAKPRRAYLIGGILAVIILLAGATAFTLATRTNHSSSSTTTTAAQQQTTITYTGEKGKTALAQLKEREHVTTKSSQYGEYVDSINGVQGGTGGKYWSFYVNNKLSEVGAGAYTSTGGESITWKFE